MKKLIHCKNLTGAPHLTLAAPQVAEGGREGAKQYGVNPGDQLPMDRPQVQQHQKHDGDFNMKQSNKQRNQRSILMSD